MSTAILSVTYRISSELRSQATAGLVSTTVGDHVGIRGAVGSYLLSSLSNLGGLAQMVERSLRMREVRGSMPLASKRAVTVRSGATGLVSIVVSIPACHAGDPGSIPGLGVFFFLFPLRPARVHSRTRGFLFASF